MTPIITILPPCDRSHLLAFIPLMRGGRAGGCLRKFTDKWLTRTKKPDKEGLHSPRVKGGAKVSSIAGDSQSSGFYLMS